MPRNRPKGLKYKIKVKNKGWFLKGRISTNGFKKGNIPWNKGIKLEFIPKCAFKKGHTATISAFKKGNIPFNWKGDNVGYVALHTWVNRYLGKPTTCQHCGKIGLKGRQIGWANIDHTYKRNLTDWIRLCAKCHKIYDISKNLKHFNFYEKHF